MKPRSADRPAVESGHLRGYPAFVQENQLLGRDGAEGFDELRPPLAILSLFERRRRDYDSEQDSYYWAGHNAMAFLDAHRRVVWEFGEDSSALDNLLNLQTTGYSIRTLSESWSKHPDPIGPDGSAPEFDWIRNADQGDPKKAAYLIETLQNVWGVYHCPPMEQMSFYVKISECLRQRAIPCVVVIPPIHEAVAQAAQSGSAAKEVAAWKRQLRVIFPHVIDLSFSAYDSATNFYRSDPVHFKPDVGIRFMNQEVLPVATRLLRETSPLSR